MQSDDDEGTDYKDGAQPQMHQREPLDVAYNAHHTGTACGRCVMKSVSRSAQIDREIVNFLNGRFEVVKTADLMKAFYKFCNFKRVSDQDYISFVQTFESN